MGKRVARPKWSRKWIGIAAAAVLLLLCAVFFLRPQHTDLRDGDVRLVHEGSASQIKKGAERKGQFVIASSQLPVDVKVYKSSERTARQICQLLYEPLLSVTDGGEVKPVLADRVTFSSDGRSAEVTLGKHRFSDGSSVTAQDVYSAYLLIAAKDSENQRKTAIASIEGAEAYIRGAEDGIAGIEILNEGKMRFTFSQPSVRNLEALTVPVVKETQECEFPLGSGSYQLESFQGLQEVTLGVNPHGAGNFDYKKIRFVNGTRQALEQGAAEFSIDAMVVGNQEIYELAKSTGGYDIYAYPSTERAYITFAPQSSLTVRQTVGAAFQGDDFWENVNAIRKTPDGNLPVSGFASPRYAGKDAMMGQLQKLHIDKLTKELAEERGKASVTLAIPDTTVNRSYYGILAQQFAEAGIELQADFNGSPESCDMALSFVDLRSPEEILRETIGSAEYDAWIAQQLHQDYRSVYSALEKQAVNTLPVIPMGAAANKIAILADCRDQALLELLLEA